MFVSSAKPAENVLVPSKKQQKRDQRCHLHISCHIIVIVSLVSLTIMGQGDFFLPISGTTWSKPQIASRNLADMAGARSHDSHCHVSHFVTIRNPETVTTFLMGVFSHK